MATEGITRGDNRRFFGESAHDLIAEFARTDYGKVVETVALSTGARDSAEDAVQVALLRILTQGWRPLHLGLHVTVLATDLIYSRDDPNPRLHLWAQRILERIRSTEAVSDGDLRHALSALPRGQRLVSLLHYYLAYPVSDIAVVLGVPRLLVAARLRRVKSKLNRLLGEETGR